MSAKAVSSMEKVNEKTKAAHDAREQSKRDLVAKFLPALQAEANKEGGPNLNTLVNFFSQLTHQWHQAEGEKKEVTKNRKSVAFPLDLVDELRGIVASLAATDDSLHLFIRKLAMRSDPPYDRTGFARYRLSIQAHAKQVIFNQYVEGAIIGGTTLLDHEMALTKMHETLQRTLKRISDAYKKVCEDEVEHTKIVELHEIMKATKPSVTLAEASRKFFQDKALKEVEKKNEKVEKADERRDTKKDAAGPAPPAVGMPDVLEGYEGVFACDGETSVEIDDTGNVPNSSRFTLSDGDGEHAPVLIKRGGQDALIAVKHLLILKKQCLVIVYQVARANPSAPVSPTKLFFGYINSKGTLTDIHDIHCSFDVLVKINNNTFATTVYDRTNTHIAVYMRGGKSDISKKSDIIVPFNATLMPWTAQTNTLIINNLANGEQFWWHYADEEAATDASISKKMEGAGIKPNAGAGKASDTDSLMAVDA